MSNAGENRSIWFTAERLSKAESIIESIEQQVGVRLSLSSVVGRAIDVLFLSVCSLKETNDTHKVKVEKPQ